MIYLKGVRITFYYKYSLDCLGIGPVLYLESTKLPN